MNLQPQDIEVSLVRADHEQNLGQWSTQTFSGVVLYHKPTGIQVRCTEKKTQWQNKSQAMLMLEEKVKSSTSSDAKLEAVREIIKSVKVSEIENVESKTLVLLHTLLQIKVVVDES